MVHKFLAKLSDDKVSYCCGKDRPKSRLDQESGRFSTVQFPLIFMSVWISLLLRHLRRGSDCPI